METIHIALPSDENYIIGLTATAGSIAYHASRDVTLAIHVLDGGIKDNTFNAFEKKIHRLHPHVEFSRIKVDETLLEHFPSWKGNRMTYARLLLADALPDVDHIIYSDTDFLWLADISELWAERDDNVIFASTADQGGTVESEKAWADAHGLALYPDNYFCAGLSFYNLALFRKERIVEQVADFITAHPDVRFADQTALNILLNGRVRLLDNKWQTLSMCLTPGTVRKDVAIHFAGDGPWTRDIFWPWLISDACMLWYAMMDEIEQLPHGTSLKRRLSTWQRFYKRALAVLLKYRLSKALVHIVLKASGRGSYITLFDKYCKNLRLTNSQAINRALQHKS